MIMERGAPILIKDNTSNNSTKRFAETSSQVQTLSQMAWSVGNKTNSREMASKITAVLVDSVEKVQTAVEDLKSYEMLSVDCEGVDQGKDGELCLLQIATKEKVYLFDIVELEGKAFETGKIN